MAKEIIYWTTKSGSKIDIDDMSIEHLRNTLKMIVRQTAHVSERCPHNIEDAISFSDSEMSALINKSQYEIENEENFWK